jgi:hypothetical protein
LKGAVDLVEPRAQHESLGAHASHVVKCIAERPLADAGHPAQILDWNRVAAVCVQEGFRLFDHLLPVDGSLRGLGEVSVVHELNAKTGIPS